MNPPAMAISGSYREYSLGQNTMRNNCWPTSTVISSHLLRRLHFWTWYLLESSKSYKVVFSLLVLYSTIDFVSKHWYTSGYETKVTCWCCCTAHVLQFSWLLFGLSLSRSPSYLLTETMHFDYSSTPSTRQMWRNIYRLACVLGTTFACTTTINITCLALAVKTRVWGGPLEIHASEGGWQAALRRPYYDLVITFVICKFVFVFANRWLVNLKGWTIHQRKLSV